MREEAEAVGRFHSLSLEMHVWERGMSGRRHKTFCVRISKIHTSDPEALFYSC
jgi:hypothetical protein